MVTRQRRRRADPGSGGQLREEILHAAEDLLNESGDEEVLTLRAVAQRAGVTTPSVYLHFADKSALVGAVGLRVWAELGRRMREATADAENDPFQAMRRCGAAYVRFAVDHPVQYRLLMMRRPSAVQDSAEYQAAAACFRYLCEVVAPCVEAGVLRGDPEQLTLRMWSAVHGCAALLISQPGFPWPQDLDGLADDVARMAGLGTALSSRLHGHSQGFEVGVYTAVFDTMTRRLLEGESE